MKQIKIAKIKIMAYIPKTNPQLTQEEKDWNKYLDYMEYMRKNNPMLMINSFEDMFGYELIINTITRTVERIDPKN
jgi:hypothetical protein